VSIVVTGIFLELYLDSSYSHCTARISNGTFWSDVCKLCCWRFRSSRLLHCVDQQI